jgi:phosphoglycerate dehydrogenase-like enzyme
MKSPDEGDWFVNTCTVRPEGGAVRLTLAPHHLYTLTTMSGVHPTAIAEHVMAMILAFSRKLGNLDAAVVLKDITG